MNKEKNLQITVPPAVKKQVQRLALDQGETMRTFVLKALQERGVEIQDNDLADRRRAHKKPDVI